ncbi:pyrroloquinoline quinone biosynthesis peptide chaperone PqqD [Opacimonas viscosa]|uniref:Pyrroloquinoline quinone biosynthesis peptide chaperone PqqD n=1 Tax=Opacimonas viscosa TaxID=2961944 RepID=A0AA41X1Z7_9ALTE|nr:pyrroloquinoline quinone biosynthesis peptide chaperone PqqD [Opacimonas viscosa]MCP3428896.1 pyrroloquinoline quinone biosynthesis peptide chaperone PqqD [Opacimonas viscosa]
MRKITMNKLYKLQFEKVQDSYVLLFPEGMVNLNPSAAEILLQVDGQKSDQDIIQALRVKFPDAPDDLAEDVLDFLVHAQSKEWICSE